MLSLKWMPEIYSFPLTDAQQLFSRLYPGLGAHGFVVGGHTPQTCGVVHFLRISDLNVSLSLSLSLSLLVWACNLITVWRVKGTHQHKQ